MVKVAKPATVADTLRFYIVQETQTQDRASLILPLDENDPCMVLELKGTSMQYPYLNNLQAHLTPLGWNLGRIEPVREYSEKYGVHLTVGFKIWINGSRS